MTPSTIGSSVGSMSGIVCGPDVKPLTPDEIDHLRELLKPHIPDLARAEFEELLSNPKPPISIIEFRKKRVDVMLTNGFVSMERFS